MTRQTIEPTVGPVRVTDETLDRIASAVHNAAHWLPPWSDPITIVTAAGYRPCVCADGEVVETARIVGFVWDADGRVRGLRVLRSFAKTLLQDMLFLQLVPDETATRLAGRLLIPGEMLAAARRNPALPCAHAPADFVAERLGTATPKCSGMFSRVGRSG